MEKFNILEKWKQWKIEKLNNGNLWKNMKIGK